jgi:hypothetical protein
LFPCAQTAIEQGGALADQMRHNATDRLGLCLTKSPFDFFTDQILVKNGIKATVKKEPIAQIFIV